MHESSVQNKRFWKHSASYSHAFHVVVNVRLERRPAYEALERVRQKLSKAVLARGAAPVCGVPIHSDELNADIGSRKDNPFAVNEKAQGHPAFSRTRVVNLVRLAIVLVEE